MCELLTLFSSIKSTNVSKHASSTELRVPLGSQVYTVTYIWRALLTSWSMFYIVQDTVYFKSAILLLSYCF
jgi:hypothetical protein